MFAIGVVVLGTVGRVAPLLQPDGDFLYSKDKQSKSNKRRKPLILM